MPLLPNPWAGAKPTSTEQPDLIVNLRTFHNIHKRCHSGSYPYELLSERSDWLPFYEVLGRGPPPTDVSGNPGDIYADLDNDTQITIYIRGVKNWEAWNSPAGPDGKSKAVLLASHPLLTDRYLWRTITKGHFSWLTEGTLKGIGISPKTTLVDPTGDIADVFAKLIHEGPVSEAKRQTASASNGKPSIDHGGSQNYKKRKVEYLDGHRAAFDPSNTGQRAMSRQDGHSSEEVESLEGRSPSRKAAISAKANMITDFVAEAEDAIALAEQREEEARVMLEKCRVVSERETIARTEAEKKLADMEAKYKELEKSRQSEETERHRRLAYT
ncbi:hypothetical protein DXG01_006737, partial [Tephrocybe rancida]